MRALFLILFLYVSGVTAQSQGLKPFNNIQLGKEGICQTVALNIGDGISDRVIPNALDTAWLKANYIGVYSSNSQMTIQGADSITNWINISTKTPGVYNLLQSGATLKPRLVANQLNGYSAIRFDGSNDYLQTNDSPAVTNATIIFVIKREGNAGGAGAYHNFGMWNAPYYQTYAPNAGLVYSTYIASAKTYTRLFTDSWQIVAFVFDATASTVTCYKNDSAGVTQSSITLAGVNSKLTIGANVGIAYGNYSVTDILLDNTAKSSADITYTIGVLNKKYAVY